MFFPPLFCWADSEELFIQIDCVPVDLVQLKHWLVTSLIVFWGPPLRNFWIFTVIASSASYALQALLLADSDLGKIGCGKKKIGWSRVQY